MNHQSEHEEEDGIEVEEWELISVTPWQTPYAWDIISGEHDVPAAVHSAAVKWWVRQFGTVQ